jgi:hypothetical protein
MTMMVLFIVLGAFLVVQELLTYSVADLDSNDMLTAFLDTSPADQAVHAAQFPPQGGVAVVIVPGSGAEALPNVLNGCRGAVAFFFFFDFFETQIFQ